VLFDSPAYADHLKRGGLSDDQARAAADALAEALREAVAAKSDIGPPESRFSKLEWMAGTSIVLTHAPATPWDCRPAIVGGA
jgi:hypothetical protein